MLRHETTLRVRYADTDQMGYVYYGKYLEYLEVGRTEMIRQLGTTYAQVEAQGILMPVVDISVSYKQPARYDEVLTIITKVPELPKATFPFEYEILNPEGKTVLTSTLRLAFVDVNRNRPVRVPEFIMKAIEGKWPGNEL